MLESNIKAIKEMYFDMAEQIEKVKAVVSSCMCDKMVEPTVKLEHIDASALFPGVDDVKCFRQR